jgi:hypothetical protein
LIGPSGSGVARAIRIARNDAEGEPLSACSTLSRPGAKRFTQGQSVDRIQRNSSNWIVLPAPAEAAPNTPTCQGSKCGA